MVNSSTIVIAACCRCGRPKADSIARRSWRQNLRRAGGTIAAVALLGGCATIPRDDFTASERAVDAPGGFLDVRLPSEDTAVMAKMGQALVRRQSLDQDQPLTLLALSGGGANGAYGAGILSGWSESGRRPEFSVVTGVSTGALIAPFAFLGRSWDDDLRRAFTDGRASKILSFPGLRILTANSVYSGKPLRALITSCVTDKMISAIAAEDAKGRQLLIATADLDTQKLVVWDMGAIARHGGYAARTLFIDVLVASASIPGVFPPTMIAANTHERVIHEMHVDGTTINAFFAIPDAALLMSQPRSRPGGALYILLNGKNDAQFSVTKNSLLSIVEQSYYTATTASQRTSLVAVAAFGRANRVGTYITSIPDDMNASALDFRQQSMLNLFRLGRARALSNTAWQSLKGSLVKGGAAVSSP